jgi:hypothetical protein
MRAHDACCPPCPPIRPVLGCPPTAPLLPDAMMSDDARRELTELMLRYDAIGHRLWRGFVTRSELRLREGGRDAG